MIFIAQNGNMINGNHISVIKIVRCKGMGTSKIIAMVDSGIKDCPEGCPYEVLKIGGDEYIQEVYNRLLNVVTSGLQRVVDLEEL